MLTSYRNRQRSAYSKKSRRAHELKFILNSRRENAFCTNKKNKLHTKFACPLFIVAAHIDNFEEHAVNSVSAEKSIINAFINACANARTADKIRYIPKFFFDLLSTVVAADDPFCDEIVRLVHSFGNGFIDSIKDELAVEWNWRYICALPLSLNAPKYRKRYFLAITPTKEVFKMHILVGNELISLPQGMELSTVCEQCKVQSKNHFSEIDTASGKCKTHFCGIDTASGK